jgi:hypothetical protein
MLLDKVVNVEETRLKLIIGLLGYGPVVEVEVMAKFRSTIYHISSVLEAEAADSSET